MSPRTPALILGALALASLLPAAPARAAAPDARTSPLVRELLARQARAAAPLAAPRALPPAPRAAGADPFRSLPTALGSFGGTVTRPSIVAGAPFRSTSPHGLPATGKLPSTEGFVGDQYGAAITTLGDMFGDGVSDIAVGAFQAVGPAGATGSVTAYFFAPGSLGPPQVLYGEQVNSLFGFSIAGVGDVNGDGYPDLLVGAPDYQAGPNTSAGKAYLYLGSPFGFGTIPAWTFSTGNASDLVGFCVAWAGDVNNDGYDDWMVSAMGSGTTYLFKGGPGALSSTPAWTYTGPANAGYSVSTAGDVNGDGYADILIGAPGFTGAYSFEGKAFLFFGHAVKPSVAADDSFLGGQAQAALGLSVGAAGDINGDGYADFLIGEPDYDDGYANQGRVLVVYGGPNPAFFRAPDVIEGNGTAAFLGSSVATAGDINGDGYADIILGAPGVPNGTNNGRAEVYVGSQYGIIGALYDAVTSSTAGQTVGNSVGTMGDINGDGFSDYWAGGVGTPQGEVWFHFGQPFTPGFTEIVAAQGYDANAHHGQAVAAADVNGDGFDDLIVGSYLHGTLDATDGMASIYFGGPRPFPSAGSYPLLGATPDWTFEGSPGDYFGFSLANAGDVNGDGYQDFIAGSILHSDPETFEGQAQVFYGSSSGPVGGAPWQVEGNQEAALCGYAVSGGGDLNGDGYDDVVIGSPQGDAGVTYQGLARVYYGSKFGLSHTPAVTYKGARQSAFLGVGVGIVGDINGDGYDDLVVGAENDSVAYAGEGVAFVYYGSAAGVHSAADDTLAGGVADSRFGWSVYRLGDVNGDGYADVAVAAPQLNYGASNQGRLYVYLGSASGLQRPPAFSIDGDAADERLGQVGVSGGDVNGDGYADLIVGNPSNSSGATNGGAVSVYAGGPSGITGQIFAESGGDNADNYGSATLGRADFDGDGFPDLVYTAPGLTLVNASEGAALVRFGNCIWFDQRNRDRPLAAWRADDSAPISPGLRADATNSFRLHGRGRTAAGRAKLRLDAEVKAGRTPFDFAGRTLSGWQATGPIALNAGSVATFDLPATGLAAGAAYRWRARWQSKNLFFPFTPWFGTEQRNPTERHLRMAGGPGPVAVDPLPGGAVALAPASPNPSTAAAALAFTLPREGAARLALYDLRGALVRTLFDGPGRAGVTRVQWDGRDAAGHVAPAGAYFVRLTALGEEKLGKLVRLR